MKPGSKVGYLGAAACIISLSITTNTFLSPHPNANLICLPQVLYLGAAAGTTVSHVSDIVGPTGCVYAVEFAHRPGRDLINMAKSRTNVIPIIEDARSSSIYLPFYLSPYHQHNIHYSLHRFDRHPLKYCMLMPFSHLSCQHNSPFPICQASSQIPHANGHGRHSFRR